MAKENVNLSFKPQEVEAGKYQWWVDSGVSIQTKIQTLNLIQSLSRHQT